MTYTDAARQRPAYDKNCQNIIALSTIEKGIKVVKVTSPTSRRVFQKIYDQKKAVKSYFAGEITIDQLKEKGVEFVRTI